MKRPVLALILILPFLIQNCSSEPVHGTGETILTSLANSGKMSSQPIDMDDDHRHVFASSLRYSAVCAAPDFTVTADRYSETSDSARPVNGRPFDQRTTVLLI